MKPSGFNIIELLETITLPEAHAMNKSITQDAYNFRISNDAQFNFTYIDIGNNNHYIEFEGKWYLITTHERIPDFLYND